MDHSLVYPKGALVILCDLKTEKYNGRDGIVEGFDEVKQRYIVRLSENHRIKIQGKNALEKIWYTQEAREFLARIESALDAKAVLKLLKELPEHDFAPEYRLQFIIAFKDKLGNRVEDPPIREIFIKELTRSLDENSSGGTCVRVKINLSPMLRCMNRQEELLLSCVDNHYGYLPAIYSELAQLAQLKKDDEKVIELFEEIQPILVTGNYSTAEPFYKLQMLTLGSALRLRKLDMVNAVVSQLHSIPGVPVEQMQVVEARLAFAEGKYTKALEIYTALKKKEVIASGIQNVFVLELDVRRVECFVRLNDKVMAKKCLRAAKKQRVFFWYSTNNDYIRELEDLVDGMSDDKSKKNDTKTKFNVRAKCSNPACDNVEERLKQFQVCSKCRAVRYCSRKCQRTHWKSGHKNFCKHS